MRQTIRKSDLKRLVESVLNEIGDTPKGQFLLGAAQARRWGKQQQDYELDGLNASHKNGDIADRISRYASDQQTKPNGGYATYQGNEEAYNKSHNLWKAYNEGERSKRYDMWHPSNEYGKESQKYFNKTNESRNMVNTIVESVIRRLRRR